jgi:hypothetical protein
MYIEYITYSFSMAIQPHVYDSWNITRQKKTEKIVQCPFIKSPLLWYGSGFSWKHNIIMHSLLKNAKKKTFFEWNFIQKL